MHALSYTCMEMMYRPTVWRGAHYAGRLERVMLRTPATTRRHTPEMELMMAYATRLHCGHVFLYNSHSNAAAYRS